MGRIWVSGGGGGADLDVITAGPEDLRAGKVIVDKDGNPLTGTLPDRASWGVTGLAAGASVTIPAGIHDGTGKIVAKSLADQTPGNLAAGKMLSGVYGYSNGAKVTGNIASMAAQTVTPGNAAKTVSCSGKYMTGNVTVQAVTGLTAANIKKGVTVGGVTGTWEGWISSTDDVYNHGTWGFGGYMVPITGGGKPTLQSDRIDISRGFSVAIATIKTVDLKHYSKLTIEGAKLTDKDVRIKVEAGTYTDTSSSPVQTLVESTALTANKQTFTFSCGYVRQLAIYIDMPGSSNIVSERYIYKITLS